MIYAGIGSRETPHSVCTVMRTIAYHLAIRGCLLRSGGAFGADKSFEIGSDHGGGKKEIFTAQNQYTWIEHASIFHPAWERCSDYAKMLHGRNSAIMLGDRLDTPVKFVVCWTKDGKATGGTGQALRIAEHMKIPVFNLFNDPDARTMWRFLGHDT